MNTVFYGVCADSESAKTQVWLELALKYGDLYEKLFGGHDVAYDHIMGKLVNMLNHPAQWRIKYCVTPSPCLPISQ